MYSNFVVISHLSKCQRYHQVPTEYRSVIIDLSLTTGTLTSCMRGCLTMLQRVDPCKPVTPTKGEGYVILLGCQSISSLNLILVQ